MKEKLHSFFVECELDLSFSNDSLLAEWSELSKLNSKSGRNHALARLIGIFKSTVAPAILELIFQTLLKYINLHSSK